MDREPIILREGEHLDDLQNGYHIIQGDRNFRYGIDAVLLSEYAVAGTDENVIDLGTGTGIIPLLMAARGKGGRITGLELQKESCDMAARSVRYNSLEDRISIVNGDIREAASVFGAASFDVAVSNPPYMTARHGLTNPNRSVAVARHEICCSFRDLAGQAAKLLRPGGRFYLIHRPFRLAEILDVLRENRLEPKTMTLVYPYADREPNLVLIGARRGGKSGMRISKPLIVYEKPGVYTEDIRRIYGDGR